MPENITLRGLSSPSANSAFTDCSEACIGRAHLIFLSSVLPSRRRYQDYQAADIPTVDGDGASVRVMAGSRGGTTGPIKVQPPPPFPCPCLGGSMTVAET